MQSVSKISGGDVLAVFDFDGTITSKDSFNDFLVWRFGYIKFCLAVLITSPLIVLYLCGVVPNHIPKGSLFCFFFRNQSYEQFVEACRTYSIARLDRLVRAEALSRMQWHRRQGHTVVIVSASVLDWIEPWAKGSGVAAVIATIIEVKDGRLTGKFLSKNCYGPEKVKRLMEKYPYAGDQIIYAYGDGVGDREMLKIATHPFYRKFS